MKLFSLVLAAAQLTALRALAERTGLSIAEHIRRAIRQYLRKKDKS